MPNSVKVLLVVAWTVGSIAIFWAIPLIVGLVYLLACAIGWQVWKRRDTRRRAADLADAGSSRRADDEKVHTSGPASKGFGAFSWTRRD